ncbi:MAG: hypothetical protein AB7G23_19850 [Vicinamibacterales bacterium]
MARSWGGLVVRALIVVMGVVAPIVVVGDWAGAQAEPPTATTSATATTLATPPPPPQPFEPCAGGSDVGQWQMRSGVMRVRATDSVFCFDGAGFGGPPAWARRWPS